MDVGRRRIGGVKKESSLASGLVTTLSNPGRKKVLAPYSGCRQ